MEHTYDKEASSNRREQRSEQDIFEAMAAFEEAGNISITEFAKRHQVSKATVYNWQNRYRSKGAVQKEPKGFIPVSFPSNSIAEQKGAPFAACRGIIFYQRVEPAYLKALLK
jgi:hypothetical protein